MNRKHIGDLFINSRWYLLIGACALFFVISYFLPGLFGAAAIFACFAGLLTVLDCYLLFGVKGGVTGNRHMPIRFSLGDQNDIELSFTNTFPFPVRVKIIEQLPEQFQVRDFSRTTNIEVQGSVQVHYKLRPLTRGEYEFGELLCYVHSQIGLLQRRFSTAAATTVKVYPSYQQLRRYQLMATADNTISGVKRVRRLGHSMEFEKIKNYVPGDDIRTINWKATARTGGMMVNTYTDAREQQVYALIDKGRAMKMPFEGMSLLDYAINAALSVLNVVLLKQDKAGLITFSNEIGNIVPAERRTGQIHHLMEALYKQQTAFKESDYESLLTMVHRRISHRSFLLLFTNFETMSSLERQLPYLIQLSARHLVCVVFFQNTMLKDIYEGQPDTTEGIYVKTIAERFDFEKKQIVKELRRHGLLAVLTTPQHLSVDVINKYLELKARQMV